jgi:hypothetical protein
MGSAGPFCESDCDGLRDDVALLTSAPCAYKDMVFFNALQIVSAWASMDRSCSV